MKKIKFYKLQASGNDFILIDNRKLKLENKRLKAFAKKYCTRKSGIGADGLLVIEPSRKAQFKMRIFNPDASEPQMCGNGARCAALWVRRKQSVFESKAGIIQARLTGKSDCAQVKIKLSDPVGLKRDIPLKVLGRKLKVQYINTGVPHTIVFVQGLDKIDVETIGREIRFHGRFKPQGTNADFVEITGPHSISLRTYERGVEAETLACGTGTVASAIIASQQLFTKPKQLKIDALTRSGEILKVYFKQEDGKIKDVWLEGKANLVYQGEAVI